MMDVMRDSTVSMIYKDKGKRCDLKRYRPIAVNSTLYRINHGQGDSRRYEPGTIHCDQFGAARFQAR